MDKRKVVNEMNDIIENSRRAKETRESISTEIVDYLKENKLDSRHEIKGLIKFLDKDQEDLVKERKWIINIMKVTLVVITFFVTNAFDTWLDVKSDGNAGVKFSDYLVTLVIVFIFAFTVYGLGLKSWIYRDSFLIFGYRTRKNLRKILVDEKNILPKNPRANLYHPKNHRLYDVKY
ncbi:hypothetical protein [Lactiplantibacillus herbarum]|uniref:hypothetical protein n=1 Tax=Lactiplantibacillus herbarum TaxID=1670446 RepID=UPI00064F38BF|nr:hypothetical protein [Lactiplantibacillus herbarum]